MYPTKTARYSYTNDFELNEVYSFLNGVKPVLAIENKILYRLQLKDKKALDTLQNYPQISNSFAEDTIFYFQNEYLKEENKNLNNYSTEEFGIMFGYPSLSIKQFILHGYKEKEDSSENHINKLLVCLNGTVFISYKNILYLELQSLIKQKIITNENFDLRIICLKTNDILVFSGKKDFESIFRLLPKKLNLLININIK